MRVNLSPFPHSLSLSSFSLHFLILSPFPHSLSISSFSLHILLFSFSLHFLILSPFARSQDATSCATLVCPNQGFRPPSWSSLPKVVNGLFVSPRPDGGGLVDQTLVEVTVNLMSPGVVIALVAMGLLNAHLRWSGCPP